MWYPLCGRTCRVIFSNRAANARLVKTTVHDIYSEMSTTITVYYASCALVNKTLRAGQKIIYFFL